MVVIIFVFVKLVVEYGFGFFCVERVYGSRNVRGWGGILLLLERVLLSKFCFFFGFRSIFVGKRGWYFYVLNFNKRGIVWCLIVLGDGVLVGDEKNLGKSFSLKILCWVEEDVVVFSSVEIGG